MKGDYHEKVSNYYLTFFRNDKPNIIFRFLNIPQTSQDREKQGAKENKNTGTPPSEAEISGVHDTDLENEENDNPEESPMKKKRIFTHKFNDQWLNEYPWIMKSDKKGVPFCKTCRVTIAGSSTHLRRHSQSKKHINHTKKSRFSQKIDSFVQDQKKIQHKENVFAAELKLSMFLHEHNLPFLLMDHLPKLIYSVCPDSSIAKDIECGRTKVTAITNECLATESLSILLNSLRASGGFYSLIVDETTDTSTKKSLAVVIRFYHQKLQKVKDCFLGLLEVESGDSQSLFNCICELLNKHEIPINNMLGFAGDNASVIMGVKSGIVARLKEVNKDVMVLGCICHSLHLCSSAAALKLPKSIEEFVRNIYNHFSNAPKRIKEFEEFQKFVDMKPHKMLRPCQTRWLSLQVGLYIHQ